MKLGKPYLVQQRERKSLNELCQDHQRRERAHNRIAARNELDSLSFQSACGQYQCDRPFFRSGCLREGGIQVSW